MDPNIAIKNIMTESPVTVKPETKYSKVKQLFDQNDFHHLPVVGENRTVIGIISLQDCLENERNVSSETSGHTWTRKFTDSQTARDIMTPYPIALDPDDSIGLAADIFLANRFHALPIVEDNELLGIVTTHDLLKYAYANEFA